MSGDLDETNYKGFAKAIIEKYFGKGMVLDGMVWGQIVGHYEAEIERLKEKAGE